MTTRAKAFRLPKQALDNLAAITEQTGATQTSAVAHALAYYRAALVTGAVPIEQVMESKDIGEIALRSEDKFDVGNIEPSNDAARTVRRRHKTPQVDDRGDPAEPRVTADKLGIPTASRGLGIPAQSESAELSCDATAAGAKQPMRQETWPFPLAKIPRSGHANCPCGSQLAFRRCHTAVYCRAVDAGLSGI